MGLLTYLCKDGDKSFVWDKSEPAQIEEARKKFKKWQSKGLKIFQVKKGKQIPMKSFDPNVEEILVIETTKLG